MHATADPHRSTSRPGDLAEDLAVLVVMLSGAILVVTLIVAAFLI
jgi:hypothetical protein